MHDVNWWLMAVAFILGLVLTLFSMIDRLPSGGRPPEPPPIDDQ
jgi:hypothetical protein